MFSFLQKKRVTAEEKILVGKVQETEQQAQLEEKTVETHQFETNRLAESAETVITVRTGRSSHETSRLQRDLRNNGTSSQKLNTEFQQKNEEDLKIQAVETLASIRKENQKGMQRSNEEQANLSQQLQHRESELCHAQEMVRCLRNQLAELENAVQQKDAGLKAEKRSKTQSLETLASTRREYDERLQRSDEERASLGEQLQKRVSLLSQAQETIDGLRYQLAENEKTLNTERIRSSQVTRQKDSMLQAEKDSSALLQETLESTKKECEETLERSNEEGARLRQRYVESQSELRQAQETVDGLRNQLAESEKMVSTDRTASSQITTSLQSDLQEISEKLKENEEMSERSKEQRERLSEQYGESQSELRRAQETVDGLRNQLAESEKMVSTERTASLQITTSLQSDLRRSSERLKEYEEMLERSDEELERLNRQHEESQSELRRAKETIIESRRDWTIPRDEIEISDEVLGKGGWGWVKEGKFRGTKVAVKQMHEVIVSSYNIKLFEREMKIAASCRHPNLLQFLGATNDNAVALFVTELMDTDLRTELTQRSLKYKEVIALSLDVNLALNYLHLKDPPIVHRDISSANVLLWKQGKEWRAKLSDYGSANLMQECQTACPGASIYAAPEARTSTRQSPKVSY